MSLDGKNIFIVEDNSMNRVVYTMILQRLGVKIEFDRWGSETITRLEGFNPNLIILDLMLKQGNTGFNIFEQIRNKPEYQHVPVVAISASEPGFAIPKCREYGFSGFIAKPIEDELLPNQLERLMAGERIWYMGSRYGGEMKD